MLNMLYQGDVRQVLPTIRIPTMVMAHARSARIPVAHSEYLAENIAGARYVELPGDENLAWAGDQTTLLSEVQEFLTGVRPREEPDRVLATVLFTDIVESTRRAAEVGDDRWRSLLAAHDQAAQSGAGAIPRSRDQDHRRRLPCRVRRTGQGDPVCRRDPGLAPRHLASRSAAGCTPARSN